MLHATAFARALRPGTLSKDDVLSLVYSESQPVQIMLRGRFCALKRSPEQSVPKSGLHPMQNI